jgi:ABC-type transporter Mla subunit MlaD
MGRKSIWVFVVILVSILVLACSARPRVLVLYDNPQGLKPGDRVLFDNQVIGSVGDFDANPKGDTTVPLFIKRPYRAKVTDKSRFVIEHDPLKTGSQSVRMVQLSPGGKPLPDEAVVVGSNPLDLTMEKGSSGFTDVLQDILKGLEKQISGLPVEQWRKELERQLDLLNQQIAKGTEEARRRFQKEILPRIEQAVQELLRQLRKLGKEDEGKTLERKLDQLERTVNQ